MKTEKQVKEEIKKYLKSLGGACWFFMPHMNGYGRAGIPDFVGCYKGRFFAIEAKAEGKLGAVTAWQKREGADILAASGRYIITDSLEPLIVDGLL
jgi:hypothetical protein